MNDITAHSSHLKKLVNNYVPYIPLIECFDNKTQTLFIKNWRYAIIARIDQLFDQLVAGNISLELYMNLCNDIVAFLKE